MQLYGSCLIFKLICFNNRLREVISTTKIIEQSTKNIELVGST